MTPHCSVDTEKGVQLFYDGNNHYPFQVGNEFFITEQDCNKTPKLYVIIAIRLHVEKQRNIFWQYVTVRAKK